MADWLKCCTRILIFFVLTFSLVYHQAKAQGKIGFTMPEGKRSVEIPFEEYSNLIVITIVVNGFLPLKFVLDTGAESVILTQKIYGDLLRLSYVRDITVRGAGIVDSLQAYVATNVSMSLGGEIKGEGLNILVLKEDYIRLSETLGEEVNGIIGYDIFSRFVVEINYDDNMITLYRPEDYKPKRYVRGIPITIVNTKPYVDALVVQNEKVDSVRLMVDSGASHAILLDVDNTEHIELPANLLYTRVGQGLGGEIPGFLGRLSAFSLDNYYFKNILASIPADGAYASAIKRGSRHGTMGGDVLCRFAVTFDYHDQMLYLQKGKEYGDPFEFDMSGMSIAAVGEQLDSIVIDRVLHGTPAFYAGLKVGDKILSINKMSLDNTKFSEIVALLKKKDKLKIRMTILRDGKRIRKVFRLKRMI